MKAREIELPVAHYFSVFRNLVVANVSHGFAPLALWEMDLAVVSKSGYLYEVEIKTSKADLLCDLKKDRWNSLKIMRFHEIVSQYFIAMPEKLFTSLSEEDLKKLHDFPGILTVKDDGTNYYTGRVKCIRPSTKKRGRKLSDNEMYQLARLGAIRYWTRHEHKRNP